MTPSDDSRFFEYGEIFLDVCDPKSRTASVKICMPCCLFQTITPHLLGGGWVDDMRLKSPLAVWIPAISMDRLNQMHRNPGAATRINVATRSAAESVGRLFTNLQDTLVDPSDIIPLLPMGTYVTFTYRFIVDDALKILEGVDSVTVVGVSEFQMALASVLSRVITLFEQVPIGLLERT